MTAIAYPAAPALPGATFRHVVMPDDLRGMNDVANAVRSAEGQGWATSDEQFRSSYEHLSNCDPATDVMVAERNGRIVGYGLASWFEDLEGQLLYETTTYAHPHEAPELLAAIHDAMEARCREIAATHPPGPKLFEAEGVETATARLAMLQERGYVAVRTFVQMLRPHLEALPGAPLPDGLEIREVRPEHLRAIFDAEVEALRDHWGMGLPTEEDYQHFLTDPVQGRYELWRVAWDGDQVAGMVRGFINDEENRRYRRKRGWSRTSASVARGAGVAWHERSSRRPSSRSARRA